MRDLQRSRLVRGAFAALIAAVLAAPGALAQGRQEYPQDDPERPAFRVQQPSVFRLFAFADFAASGMFGVGNLNQFISNYGPNVDYGTLNGFVIMTRVNKPEVCSTGCSQTFDLTFGFAVPPYEWNKARALVPSLDSARGGGYSLIENFSHLPRKELGPDDGALGRDFAGVLATPGDGACTDHSGQRNAFMGAFPLLPNPGCPQTLVGGAYNGDYPITQESYQQLAATQGASFNFDFWRVPSSLKRLDRFMGNNFNTFGVMTDHYQEMLARYGGIVPGGTGSPQIEGWPLGLRVEFQAFNFAAPAIAGANFWQVTVINESQELYGVGLDYDSLYMFMETGSAHTGQAGAHYWEPQRSVGIMTGNAVTAGCNGATNPVTSPSHACLTSSNRGFNTGALAVMMLKTPIGDMRNKLFTRAGSPFFGLGDPQSWDDTITLNHGHICGFGGCNASTYAINERRGYGMAASKPDDVIDGRALSSMSESEYWRTFRSRRWPQRDGLFNTMVPQSLPGYGAWDYNEDGVADTLYYDSCGGPRNMSALGLPPVGCVRTYGDTLPGKQNNRYGNTGTVHGVGPFSLAAGDTTGMIVAFVGEPDSIRFESAVNAVLDAYMSFFLLAEAPPVVDVVASEVTYNAVQNTRQVAIFYSDAPERWVDPFLAKIASDVAAAAPGTVKNFAGQLFDLARLRSMNPGLVAAINARATDNFGTLEIYKSCDGGSSFTGDADCDGDPAVDNQGRPVGTGWRAYATIARAAGGADIANVFRDANIQGGRSMIYSFVSKSRGARFTVADSVGGAVVSRELVLTDSLQTPLSRSSSDPNVLAVYIPASSQAGSSAAAATVAPDPAGSTVPFTVSFAGVPVAGDYRALFGNKIMIDQTTTPQGTLLSSRVILQDTVRAVGPTTAILESDTAVTTDRAGIAIAVGTGTTATTTTLLTTPDSTTTRVTYSGRLGFVVLQGNNPLFASTNPTGDAATPPSALTRADYAGFTISANNTLAGTFASEATLRPNGDTITQANMNNVTGQAQWVQGSATRVGLGGGTYRLTWASDPFGLSGGLTLDLNNPDATRAELEAALRSRTVGTTGSTDAATATLTGIAAASLTAVRLPFTIVNQSYGNRPVRIAMRARADSTYLLGSGDDTVRVVIPADEWVPGDSLIFIESVTSDSMSGGLVVLSGGQPIPWMRDEITFRPGRIGCDPSPRLACNPVRERTPGATGFVPIEAGSTMFFTYYVGFDRPSEYVFTVSAPVTGAAITSVSRARLDSIRVVPNPYVVFSAYQPDMNTSRVLFTHLPPRGTIRIYTVSGQFVQQIVWTETDLRGNGDVYYDLTTREGTALATGLYIWVLSTPIAGGGAGARGKFVVIRGRAQ